ncbi:MAG TPA: hypothetical protein VLI92_03360 [Candidatus Saccharimonadales bacterium]|nr:hypothetical protein [Candidatus Saccharimonadales bacterium]
MLLTSHTFVGIAIAYTIPNPFIAVPLSFAMHFAGDLVPHWDFYSNTTVEARKTGWRPLAVMAEFGIAVAVGVLATTHALWVLHNSHLALNIFLCAIAACLPDALTSFKIFFEKVPGPIRALARVQHKLQFQAPLPWGVLTQLFVIVASSLVILNSAL